MIRLRRFNLLSMFFSNGTHVNGVVRHFLFMVVKMVFIIFIIYISDENLIPLLSLYFHASRLLKSLVLINVCYRLFEAGTALRTYWWWIRLLSRGVSSRPFIVWKWCMFPIHRVSENVSLLMMMREGRCQLNFSGNSCRVHNLSRWVEAAHEICIDGALWKWHCSQVRQDHLSHAVDRHETDLVVLV